MNCTSCLIMSYSDDCGVIDTRIPRLAHGTRFHRDFSSTAQPGEKKLSFQHEQKELPHKHKIADTLQPNFISVMTVLNDVSY